MISTIQELVELTEREVADDPFLVDEILLRAPGCTIGEINQIRAALPRIPDLYLHVAAQVALPNVSIGYLNLAPGRRHDGSLLERLTNANSSAWPQWEFVDHHSLYHVADYESDMICIVRDSRPNVSEVVRLDLSCPPTPVLHRTAWTFEQLLIGFGRLREQFLNGRFGPEAIEEVLASLENDFHFDDEQMEDWTWFAEVALSEDEESHPEGVEESSDRPSRALPRQENQSEGALEAKPTVVELPRQSIADDLDADIISVRPRPRPDGYDAFAAIPAWPEWEVSIYIDRFDGSEFRSYYTILDGYAYSIAQYPPTRGQGQPVPLNMQPRIELSIVNGRPKPRDRDWDYRSLATIPLVGFDPNLEAREEIAAYRRRLPELLAKLPAHRKK